MPLAEGGTITFSGVYKIHTFLASSTINILMPGNFEYLIVGAGGSGGSNSGGVRGGAGGAGGLITGTSALTPGVKTVTVGVGSLYANGGNSLIGALIAYGGGKGANATAQGNGYAGGCGGGASASTAQGWYYGGAGSQGYNGGNVYYTAGEGGGYYGAGGGGMAGAGGDGEISPGNPGTGLANSISGSSVTYSRGGCGSTYNASPANIGRGGDTENAGGSGIIILRYIPTIISSIIII